MRSTVFVCVGFHTEIITKTIYSDSIEDASSLFQSEFGILPKEVLGPFYKKKAKVEITHKLKFTNKMVKAVYNNWIVNAFLLEEPVDKAYLVFIKRSDDKKASPPKGTVVVSVADLRII